MKLHALSLSLFLGISPLLGSDHLTIEQQNDEMRKAFSKKEKPINSPQLQNILNEFTKPHEFTKQIFPHQNLTSNHSSSVMTLDSWEQIKKQAAEIMFHRLNDALNFVLTNREILLSAILKNPKLIGLTCYTVGQGEQGELYFDFPLLSATHPVATLAQGYLILKEYQYWIDVLLLFKNTAFPKHALSSYDHNAAVAIKDLIQNQIRTLEEKINAQSRNPIKLSEVIDQADNHDVSYFVKADHSFHDLLKGCLTSIDDALPKGTITQINLRTAPLKKKEHMVSLGKNKRESVLENLSSKIGNFHTYFSKNYTAILTGIRSMAVMDYITTNCTPEEVNGVLQTPFYAGASMEYKQLLQGNIDFDRLFNSLTKNVISVQEIRKELGLPKEIFKGLNFEKEMQKALKNYELAKQEILMEQLQNQENVRIKAEADHRNYNKKTPLIELKVEQELNQQPGQMGPVIAQEPQPSSIISNTTEEEEENCVFDSSYFKLIHQYHQNQKSQNTTGEHSKKKLSPYEIDLYSYLMDNIFRPKQRPTWSNLVSNLTGFGFKGSPNTSGNGSTWEFSVTDKNVLFFTNPDYKGATFNVHEFKGNDPIHPRYLMYFQSGFSNVFGLTEEYITKALEAKLQIPPFF